MKNESKPVLIDKYSEIDKSLAEKAKEISKAVAISQAPQKPEPMEPIQEEFNLVRKEEVKEIEPNSQDKIVQEQIKTVMSLYKTQEDLIEKLQNKIMELESREPEAVTPNPAQVVAQESAQEAQEAYSSFTMKYEEQKEGFLAHNELQAFLRILEKNPETFEIKLTIKRK